MHIGENHQGCLGSGRIGFPAFFGALASLDHRRPSTFESFASAVVTPGLSNNLALWRNLWNDGSELSSHAQYLIHVGLHDPGADVPAGS